MIDTGKTQTQLVKALEIAQREIQIASALDRVRMHALKMRESTELTRVAHTLFNEFQELGFSMIRSSIHTWDESTDTQISWQSTGEGRRVLEPLRFSLTRLREQSLISRQIQVARAQGKPHIVFHFNGEALRDYYRHWWHVMDRPLNEIDDLMTRMPDSQFMNLIFSSGIDLSITTSEPLSEDDLAVAKRFADVFDMAYTRFLELKNAEALAHEAEQRAAVDRVRAEAAAMKKTEDIANVVKTLWEGLKGQRVDFGYLTLYMADKDVDVLHAYAAIPLKHPILDLIPKDVETRIRAQRTLKKEMLEGVDLLHSEIALSKAQTMGFSTDGFTSSRVIQAPRNARLVEKLWGFVLPEAAKDQYALRVGFGHGDIVLNASQNTSFSEEVIRFVEYLAGAVALGFTRFLDFHRLEKQNAVLEEANREIQVQTQRKSAFLASMSHELRTPMNAIIGFTRLVLRREPSLTLRGKENLEKVAQASDHLMGLINDILDLSKIEAGKMDVAAKRFDVKHLIGQCVSTVSPLVKEGVALRCEVGEGVGEAFTDEGRVRQMVINLLSNAIKFTDRGEVKVVCGVRSSECGVRSAEKAEASVESGKGDDEAFQRANVPAFQRSNEILEIVVSDTGVGIPSDKLRAIFEEFVQVKGGESAVQKGTGLGLSITKKLAALLGGSIGVESTLGRGTAFTLRIPAVYGHKQHPFAR